MPSLYREVPTLLVVVPLAAIVLVLLLAQLRRRGALTVLRGLVALAACVYLAGVVANTVLPIYLDKPASGVPWHAYLNLEPLTDTDVADMLRNVLVFVPLGVLLPLVTRLRSALGVTLGALGLSLAMELVQLVNSVSGHGGHVADVNDLLANTLGAPLGYLLLRLVDRAPAGRRRVKAATWPPQAGRRPAATTH